MEPDRVFLIDSHHDDLIHQQNETKPILVGVVRLYVANQTGSQI